MSLRGSSLRRHIGVIAVGILAAWLMVGCSQVGAPTANDTATDSPPESSSSTTEPTVSPTPPVAPETDSDDFVTLLGNVSALCGDGAGMPGTTAYDPAAQGRHPVFVVTGDHPDYDSYFPVLWSGDGVVGNLDANQYTQAQLVACVDGRKGLELARACGPYGGSEDHRVEIYEAAEYHITVHVAATGKPLTETSVIESELAECPLLVNFSHDQTVVRRYSGPSEESLRAVLAPLIGGAEVLAGRDVDRAQASFEDFSCEHPGGGPAQGGSDRSGCP
ncbi:hypothetical protein [Cryobacterium psychrophilum]|uniref:Uncharacterized protein n=1 Tax=Cryobacterium psychrophilum TaxID=41988 RepID=A0A4Y8KR45_9MICO|nr:hypothetical protein [Cryobacterium psychrophilum]TDW30972.1 hypothetical protein EDD25_2759 [Cryobacterium psychrophilum]TFD80836.1 hypothetical protein E3T53_04215 [Cryobacterium psychrophilum]